MIVLITGASVGFDAAMARKFVKHSHKVIATDRRKDRLEALAVKPGASILPIVMDVSDKASIDQALAALAQELERTRRSRQQCRPGARRRTGAQCVAGRLGNHD